MSEENKTSNDNEQPAGREGQNQPAILINTQYIKDLSLEIPHAPEIFKEIKSAPEVQINVEVGYQTLENNFYNVELKLNMDGDVNHQKLFYSGTDLLGRGRTERSGRTSGTGVDD